MADPIRVLTELLEPAFTAVAGEPADPVVRRSDRADYQADGALALAKRLGRAPRDVAADVVSAAAPALEGTVEQSEIAGPGFVNLVVTEGFLGSLLLEMAADDRLGVAPDARPEVVVVDYSAPNVAKEMHVGRDVAGCTTEPPGQRQCTVGLVVGPVGTPHHGVSRFAGDSRERRLEQLGQDPDGISHRSTHDGRAAPARPIPQAGAGA